MDEKLHKASISMVWHPPETNGDWTPKKWPHTQLSGEGRLCYPTPRGCTPAMVNSDRPIDGSALALFLLWASRPAAPTSGCCFWGSSHTQPHLARGYQVPYQKRHEKSHTLHPGSRLKNHRTCRIKNESSLCNFLPRMSLQKHRGLFRADGAPRTQPGDMGPFQAFLLKK